MNSPLTRRRFFACSTRTLFAAAICNSLVTDAARAINPIQRPGAPRLLLGLAAYSFRDRFKDNSTLRANQAAPADGMDMFDFVDYCAEHGCRGAEVTSYFFPAEVNNDYLLRLKHRAFLRGIALSGTAIGNTFTHAPGAKRDEQIRLTKTWIDRATVLGVPHIRVFAGSTQGESKEVEKKLCIEALEECGAYAATKGIFLGLENHGGIVADPDDLLDIVRAVKNPWIGINLDTANFQTTDPYADLARCAPYAVNVQIKTEIQPRGAAKQPADLGRLVKILRDANYQGFVVLEYEASENARTAVPRHLKELGQLLLGS